MATWPRPTPHEGESMGSHRAEKGESTSQKNARNNAKPTAEERTKSDAEKGLEATKKFLRDHPVTEWERKK